VSTAGVERRPTLLVSIKGVYSMLVLTRKQGERIQIGEDITITVVRTKGKSVRLGIVAPSHVPVLRGEIAKAIAAEAEQPSVAPADGDGPALESTPDRVRGLGSIGVHGPLHELVGARGM
jgi:carbon storage regulator